MTGAPTRTLADLRISPIGLGGNVFGWTADEATSFEVLDAYLDGGGNLIDTADGILLLGSGELRRGVGDRDRRLARFTSCP